MINFCINGIDKVFEVEDFDILRITTTGIEWEFNEKIILGEEFSMTEIIHNFCQKIGMPEFEFELDPEVDDIVDDVFEFEFFPAVKNDVPATLLVVVRGRDFK